MKIACCLSGDPAQAALWIDDLRRALPEAQVHDVDPEATYAVVWRATPAFVASHSRLKAVFAAGAGVDAVMALPWPATVPVVRLEDAGMGDQMADYVSAAVLHEFRDFGDYAVQQRAGQWEPKPPHRKSDWPVGILGFGVLGKAVATRMRALGFPVTGWARTAKEESGVVVHAGAEGLSAFLAQTRVLVAMLPLTRHTEGLIDRRVLAALRRPGLFINVARGGLVVEEDLLAVLDEGWLSRAIVDVCRDEPAPVDHPFRTHPKVVFTPHVAAATLREEAVAQIAHKIRAMEAGEPISGSVSRDTGY